MDYYGLMLHILRILATFLPGALVASACLAAPPQTPQHQTAAPGDRPIASALLDATLFYEILLGEIVTREGDPGTGYALVLEAARRSGSPVPLAAAVSQQLNALMALGWGKEDTSSLLRVLERLGVAS